MTFWLWIILASLVSGVIGMIGTAFIVSARGADEIITDLVGALQEWVDAVGITSDSPTPWKSRYDRSVRALNRARGMWLW